VLRSLLRAFDVEGMESGSKLPHSKAGCAANVQTPVRTEAGAKLNMPG